MVFARFDSFVVFDCFARVVGFNEFNGSDDFDRLAVSTLKHRTDSS